MYIFTTVKSGEILPLTLFYLPILGNDFCIFPSSCITDIKKEDNEAFLKIGFDMLNSICCNFAKLEAKCVLQDVDY